MIKNPIIPGFAGDPCVIRVGDDYYLATSSFEWNPGVAVYHSLDLKHWELCDYILKEKRLNDLTGVYPSGGMWAPDLSYNEKEKRFYLVYNCVRTKSNLFFDIDNFITYSDSIHGPWCDPIYIGSNGFDPTLFIDDDGRKWIAIKDRDTRRDHIDTRAIVLREFDLEKRQYVGEPVAITRGATERRFVEGAHIYKYFGKYYLMAAEGGTGYGHCVTMLRADKVTGPYEPYPGNPIITSHPENFVATEDNDDFMMKQFYNPETIIQKSGHGSLVETQNGEFYVAHLCARPLVPEMKCILGRETSLQKMKWTDDGWLVMADGSNLAKDEVPEPDLPDAPLPVEPETCDFDDETIPLVFQTVRNEISPDWASTTRRKGYLSLRGRDSLISNFYPSLLARRLTAFHAIAETKLEFTPDDYHHRAGLTYYYDLAEHFYIFVTKDKDDEGPVLMMESSLNGEAVSYDVKIPLEPGAPVWLRGEINCRTLQFSYSTDGKEFIPVGPEADATILSDEGGSYWKFTGTYVGIFAMDTFMKSKWADFDSFTYRVLE